MIYNLNYDIYFISNIYLCQVKLSVVNIILNFWEFYNKLIRQFIIYQYQLIINIYYKLKYYYNNINKNIFIIPI